ncbi:hypothetical protein D3C80_1967360 [compost metagenome]
MQIGLFKFNQLKGQCAALGVIFCLRGIRLRRLVDVVVCITQGINQNIDPPLVNDKLVNNDF